jgi:hypothetical protein
MVVGVLQIYMEYNHCVIMERCPRNQLIARIQMTSNKMFPLTLKPSMKIKKVQTVGECASIHCIYNKKQRSKCKQFQGMKN